jgi:hypothetical protein
MSISGISCQFLYWGLSGPVVPGLSKGLCDIVISLLNAWLEASGACSSLYCGVPNSV